MATVWRAHDRVLGRDVAIKVLDPHGAGNFDRDRFLLEIRVTARLVHPAILPLFDSGTAGDSVFFVMPLVQGETLRHRLDREHRLSVADTVAVVSDLAEALAYAHGEGIVHRDLKPENVFCHAGRTLLADFGVSRAVAMDSTQGGERLTSTGVVIGTPLYLSPEQALGESHIDGRADLYALGCLFYESLAGRPPFHGGSMMALIAQHVTGAVPEVTQERPDAGAGIARIVSTLLAKDPDDRYATASAFLAELRRVNTPSGHASGEVTGAAQAVPSAAQRIADAGARNAYINGRNYWMRSMQGGRDSESKLKLARVYLERANQLSADHPDILAALSDCIRVFGLRGFAPLEETRVEAYTLLHRALAIDDSAAAAPADSKSSCQ